MRLLGGSELNNRGRSAFLLGFAVALLAATLISYVGYLHASSHAYRGDSYYISDEVWYATSARNLLVNVFHIDPVYRKDGYRYATLVFPSNEFLERRLDEVSRCVESLGGGIVRGNYTTTGDKIPLLWVRVPEANYSKLAGCPGVQRVIGGYQYPSKSNIHNYLNTEHPPLGKYIIGLSMTLLGDKPLSWRIPGLLEAAAIIIIVYLAGWRVGGLLGGLVAITAAMADPLLRNMSVVAMLDIHLTFFTALALLLAVYDRPLAAMVAAWLSFSVKFSGLFTVLAVYLFLRLVRRLSFPRSLLYTVATSMVYLAVSAPMIMYRGLDTWVEDHLGAIRWHTTSRGSGPPTSTPVDWLLNARPMGLHYNPDLIASTNPVLLSLAMLAAVVLVPLLLNRDRSKNYVPAFFFLSVWLGYSALYLKGNRTLYSFYAVQLSPAAAVMVGSAVYLLYYDAAWLRSRIVEGWKRILDHLSGREPLPLPGELFFLRPLHARRNLVPQWLALVMAAALSAPLIYGGIGYSYILDIFRTKGVGPGAQMPYLDYQFSGPGLAGYLTYLIARFSSGPSEAYMAVGAIAFFASLSLVVDLADTWRRRLSVFPLLLMLFYAANGWTILAAALVARAMYYERRGRYGYAAVLVGVAGSLNTLALLYLIPLIFRGKSRAALLAAAGFFNPATLLAAKFSLYRWLEGVAMLGPRMGGLGALLGLKPLVCWMLSMALALFVLYVLTYRNADPHLAPPLMVPAAMLLLAHVDSSWLLLSLPFMAAFLPEEAGLLALVDVLAGAAAVSWSQPGLIVEGLFKCSPATALEPCSSFSFLTLLAVLISTYISFRAAARLEGGTVDLPDTGGARG